MNIIDMNIADLIPYENNPRKNDSAVDKVAKSIEEFGWEQPIVVDKNNVIVIGHTRRLAAIKLGYQTVPVYVASHLSDKQIRALRLADNKVAEFSSWDFDKLDEELAAMEELDFDINEFGFADTSQIDWDSTPDLTEDSYEQPQQNAIRCPNCGHTAGTSFFKKVKL